MSNLEKHSNILDPVHDTLDQDVFNGMTPKEDFFEYHLDHIREVFRQNDFNPHAFDFYLTGSLCTYQYSKTSDVDISIVCNVDEFTEEDRADLISIVINSLDGEFFPRTQHQYQHFVQPIGVDIEDLFVLGLRGAWNFQEQKWVLKPSRKRAHDVSKEQPDWILSGIQVSDKINALIDNNNYDDAIDFYKKIHERRKEDQIKMGDYSEGNIIYKLLDNNGTFDRLRNIGQKIAFNKESFFINNDKDFYNSHYFDIFDRSTVPTHLNKKGRPCHCNGGKKNFKAVKEYYDNLKNNELLRFSSVKKVSAPQNIEEMINLLRKTDLKEGSKFDKKFPGASKYILEDISSLFSTLTPEISKIVLKYIRGFVNILKNSVRESYNKKIKSAEKDSKIIEEILKLNQYLKYFNNSNNTDQTTAKLNQLRTKIIQEREKVLIDDNAKRETINFLTNLRDIISAMKSRNLNYITGNLDLIFDKNNEGKDTYEKLLDAIYIDKYIPEWIINLLFNYNFAPKSVHPSEKVDFRFPENQKKEDSIKETYTQLNQLFDEFRLNQLFYDFSEAMEDVEEYNIPFKIQDYKNVDELKQKITEILKETEARKEYKELLEGFKEDGWEAKPVFEYEEKKGNPYGATPGTWTVAPVVSEHDVEWEGQLMDHCLNNPEHDPYQRWATDSSINYSVRDPNGIPWVTVELSPDRLDIGQVYGRHNHDIRPHEEMILNKFFKKEFGEDHEWFSRPEGHKTGVWQYLPYEYEEREPYYLERDAEDYIGTFPQADSIDDVDEFSSWLQRIDYDYYTGPSNENFWLGWSDDEDDPEIDDDGNPYYIKYSGYDTGRTMSEVFDLIKEGIVKYNDINTEYLYSDPFTDGQNVSILYVAIFLDYYYHHGRRMPLSTKTINRFIMRELLDRKNSEKTRTFLKTVYEITSQNYPDFDTIDDLKEVDIAKIGDPGSHNFYMHYGLENDHPFENIDFEEEEPQIPKIYEIPNMPSINRTSPMYNDLIKQEINKFTPENYQYLINHYNKTVDNSGVTFGIDPEKLEDNSDLYWQTNSIHKILKTIWEHNRELGSGFNTGADFFKEFLKTKRDETDFNRKETYNQENQMNFFDMPSEPTDEEMKGFAERNPSVHYLNYEEE
jgi:PcfJ-like protein